MKPFILRREKKETDLNLPPKKEIVIYAPITDVQQELYKATLNKHMEILLNQKKVNFDFYLLKAITAFHERSSEA